MKEKQPFFSVIIPTHRRPTLLKRALESIKAQGQDDAIEIVVISDIQDLNTDLVCNAHLGPGDIYIRRNGTPGPSESRNLGLSIASGQNVLFLDDDDAWHPGLASHLSECIKKNPGLPLYFNCTVVKESRAGQSPTILSEVFLNLEKSLTQAVYVKNQVHMSCFSFPRLILKDLFFDKTMRAYEDWDFLLSVFDRQFPVHVGILGSRVFEVDDQTSDRRGNSAPAKDFNAVLDYLYVYRRHPGVTDEIRESRRSLLMSVGLNLAKELM